MSLSVPTVVDALIAALTPRPALAGVLLSPGAPGRDTPDQNERVYVMHAQSMTRTKLAAQGGHHEEYDLYVLASVYRPYTTADTPSDTDQQACRDRMWAILDELDTTLDEDAELGGACSHMALERVPVANPPLQTADGYIAEAIAVLHVQARSR